jgi:hypothetical protein
MSTKDTQTSKVWTKEACIELVSKCNTKEEVEENHKEAFDVIKLSRWHYLYGTKYLGTGLEPTLPTLEAVATNALKEKVKLKDRPTDKVYKLKKYQPLSFTLNVGRSKTLIVWDHKTQRSRAIRHCPNEKSIFLDDQSKDIAVVEPIVFVRGFLNTTGKEGYTQNFIEIHPKFGILFELVNAEADAEELVSLEDTIIDIKQAIRKKSGSEGGIEKLRAIVSVLNSDPGGAAKMTPSELRFSAYEAVNANPNRFIDDNKKITIFDDDDIKRTAMAQHAFLAGVIQVSPNGRQVLWADNKSAICNVPIGMNYMKIFSEFLSTEEGINVCAELSRR